VISSTIILSNIIIVAPTFGISSNTTTIQEKSLLQNKINNMTSNAELIGKIKNEIKIVVDHNSSKSAIAIGFVDPSGT